MEIRHNNNRNICTICFQTFGKKKRDPSSNLHYQKLCDQFTSAGDLPSYNEETQLVCLNCLASVSSILDKKDQVTSAEVEVRKLQVQILKMLRSLQSKIDSFKEEMGKVERIVEGGSDKVKDLDDFYVEKDEDQGTSLKDAIQFREKILSVVQDLVAFRKDLTMMKDPTDLTVDFVRGSTQAVQDNWNDEQVPPASPDNTNFWEVDDCTAEEISIQGSEENPDDDRRSSRSESDPDFIPASWKAKKKKQRNKRLRSSILPRVDFCEDGDGTDPGSEIGRCSAENPDDVQRSSESESDPEFIPESLKAKSKRQYKRLKSPILSSMNFTGMSKFKKKLITRIVHKFEKHQKEKDLPKHENRKLSKFEDIDPLKSHFIQYDPANDSLNLSGFDITVNEKEENLQCSQCGFQTRKTGTGNPTERSMYNHILGHHLNLFMCPFCGARLTNYLCFKDHILGHNNQFDCDICGRSLKGKEALKGHKWSHMNEVEKEEAVKNGLKPPEAAEKKRKLEKRFQCTTCGKGFIVLSLLKKHEVIHEEDRKHMCPNCGKAYKTKSTLMEHLKFVCVPEKEKLARESLIRFQCDQCLMKFPFENRLKKHKALVHSQLPYNFKCGLCEKAFKTQQNLKAHAKIHSDARPHQCRKGCGAAFKAVYNRDRHEQTCKKAFGME